MYRLICLVALAITLASASERGALIILAFLAAALLFRAARAGRPPAFSRIGGLSPLLGFLLPLTPWIAPHIVAGCALSLFLVKPYDQNAARSARWAAPLFAYVLASAVTECVWSSRALLLDFGLWDALASLNIERTLQIGHAFLATSSPSLGLLAHLSLFILCVALFESNSAVRAPWRRGFTAGALVSALYIIFQWLLWPHLNLANQTNFWTSLHRISGLGSDPNAAGIVLGIALWLMATAPQARRKARWLAAVTALVMLFAGVLTGSRTFMLSVALLAASIIWAHARRFSLALLAGGALLVAAVSLLDVNTSAVSSLVESPSMPAGIKRTVTALSLPRVEETLSSRSIFLSIGREILSHSPTFGVGPGKFRDYAPLVGKQLGLLRGWSDNSNNFYIGLLTELGVCGFALFLLSFCLRSRNRADGGTLERLLLISLAVLLLTGPHTDFSEILVAVAFIIGTSTHARSSYCSQPSCRTASRLLICAALGIVAFSAREIGTYGWEVKVGSPARWLTPKASLRLACSAPDDSAQENQATLTLASRANLPSGPISISVASPQEISTLSLSGDEQRDLKIPCREGDTEVQVKVRVSPAWSPSDLWPAARDSRIVTVQQLLR